MQALLPALQSRYLTGDWQDNLPFHHLSWDLRDLVNDPSLKPLLARMETKVQIFDQLRQALRLAPVTARQGLNHAGEAVEAPTLRRRVRAFVKQVRTRPKDAATPALVKMLAQIKKYSPKLFAAPLRVMTPQGPRPLQPARTNNILEQYFRGFKRNCRHKTGDQAVGRTLRTMLADTPLVSNLRHPEYRKILLAGQPDLAARFAQIDPAAVREELVKAKHNPEKVPRSVKRFVAQLATSIPIKNWFLNLKSNRIS